LLAKLLVEVVLVKFIWKPIVTTHVGHVCTQWGNSTGFPDVIHINTGQRWELHNFATIINFSIGITTDNIAPSDLLPFSIRYLWYW